MATVPMKRWKIKLANGECIERNAQYCNVLDPSGALQLLDVEPLEGMFHHISERIIKILISPHGWLYVEAIKEEDVPR